MFRFVFPTTIAAVFLTGAAIASERHFTQSYESNVLPKNSVEIEPSTTLRMGKNTYYMGLGQRIEFEFGLTDHVQTSLYLNFGSEGAREGAEIVSASVPASVSNEWKMKLSDSVGDAIGSALYAEFTASAQEYEIEGKIILDKRMDRWLFVFNGVYEHEMTMLGDQLRREHKIAANGGATYFLSDHLTLGVEAFARTVFEAPNKDGVKGDLALQHAAISAGPVLGYAAQGWWLAMTVAPQLYGTSVDSPSAALNLDEFERVQARLLLGFHL